MKKLTSSIFGVMTGMAVILSGIHVAVPVYAEGAENPAFEYGTEDLAIRRNYEFYDDGELVSLQTILEGECLHEPEAKGKEGYVFAGWFDEDGNEVSFWTSIYGFDTDAETMRVDAKYIEAKIVAQFALEDGGVYTTKAPSEDGKVTLDVTFDVPLDQYVESWTDEDGNTYMFGSTVTLEKTTYFTANVVKKIVVSFDTEDGEPINPQYIRSGASATKPNDPIRQGYDFNGWTLDGSAFTFDTPIYEDTTIVADWTPARNIYRIYVHKEQEGTGGDIIVRTIPKTDLKTEDTIPTLSETDAKALVEANRFENFDYYEFDRVEMTYTTIKADGSSEINVYYKRKSYDITLRWDDGSYYPKVNGETVEFEEGSEGTWPFIRSYYYYTIPDVKIGDDVSSKWPTLYHMVIRIRPLRQEEEEVTSYNGWRINNNKVLNKVQTVVTPEVLGDGSNLNITLASARSSANQNETTVTPEQDSGKVPADQMNLPASFVYFDFNGGEDEEGNTDAVVPVEAWGTIEEVPEPTYEGYIFAGWLDSNDVFFDPATMIVTEPDFELKAKWIKEDEIIVVCYVDANGNVMYDEHYYIAGTNAMAIVAGYTGTYLHDGDTFVGWTLDNTLGTYPSHTTSQNFLFENSLLDIDGSIDYIDEYGILSLFAAFDYKEPVVKIYYYANNDSEDSLLTQELKRNADYTVLKNPFSKEGYVFVGWNTEADGSGAWYFPGDVIAPYAYFDSVDMFNFNELYAIWEEATEEEVVPVEEAIENPYTLDNVSLFVALAAISTIGLIGAVIYAKKEA